MKKVLVISAFKDRYTGKVLKAGSTVEMTDERIAEIKEVSKNLIEVVGKVEEPKKEEPKKEEPKKEEPEKEPKGKESK